MPAIRVRTLLLIVALVALPIWGACLYAKSRRLRHQAQTYHDLVWVLTRSAKSTKIAASDRKLFIEWARASREKAKKLDRTADRPWLAIEE